MTLRIRARLFALMCGLVFLALLIVFLIARQERSRAQHDLALTESLTFETIQLRTVLFGYLLHPQAQSRAQVEAQFEVLGGLLERKSQDIAAAMRGDEQTRYACAGVRRLVGEVRTLFADMGGPATDPGLAERERHTIELILMDSHSLILFVSQLRHYAVAWFLQASARENLTLGVLLAGMAGLSLGFFLVFERVILDPVHRLHEIAVRVTRGEMGLRLHSHRKDELGKLAHAFDQMLDQLQETTVSRDRIEAEIGERRRAEQASLKAQTRFQRLVEANVIGIVVTDATGDILEANDYYLDILGYTRAELAAGTVNWRAATPPEWIYTDERALVELSERGVCTPYEKEYVRRDGTRATVLIADALLPDPQGHILGLIRDITERRRAEAEVQRLNAELEERVRQRTAELEAANRELESFAYAVSHDLRAPLRALSGFSQALIEDYSERLDGEARVFLDQIDSASRRMGELIDGILTLSRSTRGELRHDRVDLSALACRLLTQHAGAQPGRQVAWEVQPGLTVLGDPSTLEVVMVNLIDNAWKYTAKTPAAIIRVGAQDRPADPAGNRCFCITDNGAGFNMAYYDRLFNPFQRLHRQEEFPGMGIGLATVQRIVHRHGGTITAEGVPGRGATFRFTLPTATARTESS